MDWFLYGRDLRHERVKDKIAFCYYSVKTSRDATFKITKINLNVTHFVKGEGPHHQSPFESCKFKFEFLDQPGVFATYYYM